MKNIVFITEATVILVAGAVLTFSTLYVWRKKCIIRSLESRDFGDLNEDIQGQAIDSVKKMMQPIVKLMWASLVVFLGCLGRWLTHQ